MALPQPSSGACIGGFVTGLIEYGPPNQEYVLGLQFCKSGSIVSPEKEECFESVVRNSSFIFSQTEVDSICELVAKETDISAIEHCTNPA